MPRGICKCQQSSCDCPHLDAISLAVRVSEAATRGQDSRKRNAGLFSPWTAKEVSGNSSDGVLDVSQVVCVVVAFRRGDVCHPPAVSRVGRGRRGGYCAFRLLRLMTRTRSSASTILHRTGLRLLDRDELRLCLPSVIVIVVADDRFSVDRVAPKPTAMGVIHSKVTTPFSLLVPRFLQGVLPARLKADATGDCC